MRSSPIPLNDVESFGEARHQELGREPVVLPMMHFELPKRATGMVQSCYRPLGALGEPYWVGRHDKLRQV